MIKNEKQLKIMRKNIRKFESALDGLINESKFSKDLKLTMQIDALKSDLSKFKGEVREFERLRSGAVKEISANSFHELPNVIIKARIARDLTQKELALKLGMREQQIQRYETNNFASASFSVMERIVEALDITIEEKASLNKA
ncbi:MAG: helix-turn-helix transcriptional regulator [Nitrospirota bacterium]